jgi:hypothetical protein
VRRDCNGTRGGGFPLNKRKDGTVGFVGLSRDGSVLYKNINKLKKVEKQYIRSIEDELRRGGELEEDKHILGVFEESCLGKTMGDLNTLLDLDFAGEDKILRVYSKEFYDEVEGFIDRHEVRVDTKYKTVAKKVKPVALPLPVDCEENVERASMQPNLRDLKTVGHEFTDLKLDGLKVGCEDFLMETKEKCFKKMLMHHGKAFAFESHEIGYIDPGIVAPMVFLQFHTYHGICGLFQYQGLTYHDW